MQFSDVADAAPAMLWLTAPDGTCRFLSRAWYEFTGLPAGAGLGEGWVRALHPDDRAAAQHAFDRAREREEALRIDYRVRRRDGYYRWALAVGRPWYDADGVYLGYIGSVVDIHERKESEEERARLTDQLEARVAERTRRVEALGKALVLAEQRERRRLSYVLHDELQQTLFALKMRTRLLSMSLDETDGAISEHVADLHELVVEALGTTRTLALELNPPVLHHDDLRQALAWLAGHMQRAYGLVVVVEGSAALPEGDLTVLVTQMVRELLLNVVLHAGIDQARVTLHYADGVLHVEVADEGVGFDLSLLEELQSERTLEATRAGRRSALGLVSIAERLRLFGGSLSVAAGPGEGASVSMHLPLVDGGLAVRGPAGVRV